MANGSIAGTMHRYVWMSWAACLGSLGVGCGAVRVAPATAVPQSDAAVTETVEAKHASVDERVAALTKAAVEQGVGEDSLNVYAVEGEPTVRVFAYGAYDEGGSGYVDNAGEANGTIILVTEEGTFDFVSIFGPGDLQPRVSPDSFSLGGDPRNGPSTFVTGGAVSGYLHVNADGITAIHRPFEGCDEVIEDDGICGHTYRCASRDVVFGVFNEGVGLARETPCTQALNEVIDALTREDGFSVGSYLAALGTVDGVTTAPAGAVFPRDDDPRAETVQCAVSSSPAETRAVTTSVHRALSALFNKDVRREPDHFGLTRLTARSISAEYNRTASSWTGCRKAASAPYLVADAMQPLGTYGTVFGVFRVTRGRPVLVTSIVSAADLPRRLFQADFDGDGSDDFLIATGIKNSNGLGWTLVLSAEGAAPVDVDGLPTRADELQYVAIVRVNDEIAAVYNAEALGFANGQFAPAPDRFRTLSAAFATELRRRDALDHALEVLLTIPPRPLPSECASQTLKRAGLELTEILYEAGLDQEQAASGAEKLLGLDGCHSPATPTSE